MVDVVWTDAAALQREEEKATQVIRQAARNGQSQGCHNIAVAISNSRKVCRRLETVKFRLDSVEITLQQQRCMLCLQLLRSVMIRCLMAAKRYAGSANWSFRRYYDTIYDTYW